MVMLVISHVWINMKIVIIDGKNYKNHYRYKNYFRFLQTISVATCVEHLLSIVLLRKDL